MPKRDPSYYTKDDGHVYQPSYRIYFRRQSRRIGDLNLEELRCALMDAQCDLQAIALKLPRVSVTGMSSGDAGELEGCSRVAWRHQTSRGEDEELDASPTKT